MPSRNKYIQVIGLVGSKLFFFFSMLLYIKVCFEEPTLQSTEVQKKTTAIYTARFTQAVPILMASLRKCYVPEPSNSLTVTLDENGLKRWNDLCGVLKQNCLTCWGIWIGIVMEKVEELIKDLPQEFTLEANVDFLMMVCFKS